MVREIIHDPLLLSRKSVPATEADLPVAQDLLDTLHAPLDHCVGLAANIIGERKRIIAICNGPLIVAMLNPKILRKSGEYETEERCLSLEGTRPARRYRTVTVSWQDIRMKSHTDTLNGFAAQIVQHEIDHCDGLLI
jgi:peptide deformylase